MSVARERKRLHQRLDAFADQPLIRYRCGVGFRIAIVGCLFASAVALAQPKLSGTVTDTERGAISNGLVRIHWDPAGSTVGLKTNVGVRQAFWS
jgi:hypothetical protein